MRLNDVPVLIRWNQKVTSEQIGFALLVRWRVTASLVVVKVATPSTVKKNVTGFVKKAEPQRIVPLVAKAELHECLVLS